MFYARIHSIITKIKQAMRDIYRLCYIIKFVICDNGENFVSLHAIYIGEKIHHVRIPRNARTANCKRTRLQCKFINNIHDIDTAGNSHSNLQFTSTFYLTVLTS